jgi:hypothetical protein
MKQKFRNILGLAALLVVLTFSVSGCAESHYYDTYHHHSRGWYDHHHTPPPAGVNFDVEIHQ